MRDIFLSLFLTLIFIILIGNFFLSVVDVKGHSMIPALRDRDKVLIQRTTNFKRFDIVAFTSANKSIQVRRVIGLPGETVEYKDDTLYINDQPVDEKFLVDSINESQRDGRNYTEDFAKYSFVIPKNYYFVLGDNRPYATDSRHYGLIKKSNFIGRVSIQLLPINEIKKF